MALATLALALILPETRFAALLAAALFEAALSLLATLTVAALSPT